MKVITEPQVYLLGRQTVDQLQLDRFLADHGVSWASDSEVAAEVLAETAGRVCYLSFAKPRPGGNAAYLGHIKEVGHGSILEHAVFNLLIAGVSRSLSHELVRHRAGFGYSQLSQRYVDESVAEYVVPPDLAEEVAAARALYARHYPDLPRDYTQTRLNALLYPPVPGWESPTAEERAGLLWLRAVDGAHASYVHLGDYLVAKARGRELAGTEARKFARQAARSVLPNATETKLFVTGNARALRHFLEQRGAAPADPEIRKLALAVHAVLARAAPNLFGDYAREPLPDGTFALKTPHPKV